MAGAGLPRQARCAAAFSCVAASRLRSDAGYTRGMLRSISALLLCLVAACSGSGGGASPDAGPAPCASDVDCSDGLFCNGEETCDPSSLAADALGCVAGSTPCEIACEESNRRCLTCEDPDLDGDGHRAIACGGTDCDDDDADRFPGNAEVCDVEAPEHDEDCDPTTFGTRDEDGDGHTSALCCNASSNARFCGDDCDDDDGDRRPGAAERCDDIDDDCDGDADEGLAEQSWGRDCDGDGFGDATAGAILDCAAPPMSPVCGDTEGAWVNDASDCDDSAGDVNPGNTERCNGADDDCDIRVDETLTLSTYVQDCDGDSYGDDEAAPTIDCAAPAAAPAACPDGGWAPRGGDCDDAVASTNPTTRDLCNGGDDDCDDKIDEDAAFVSFYPDCDGDARGDDGADATIACAPPETVDGCASGGQWVQNRLDCADDDPDRYRGRAEVCNGVDDDCDALVDDVANNTVVCQVGDDVACTTACGLDGTAPCAADCLGFASCRADEVCNGCDDDANGAVDDGFECPQGSSESCFTACANGPALGVRACTTGCEWAACIANEICNYCDDDGDGTIADEEGMAASSEAGLPFRGGTLHGAAVENVSSGGTDTMDIVVDIIDGVDEAGAYWVDTSKLSGYGPVTFEVEVEVTGSGGFYTGGWAIAIAHGGTPAVGAAANYGLPTEMQGLAYVWRWFTRDVSLPSNVPPSPTDSGDYFRNGSAAWGGISFGNYTPGGNALDGSTTVTQRLKLTYTPDLPSTEANEERLVARTNSRTIAELDGDDLNDARPPGTPIYLGVTAGAFSRSYQGTPVLGDPVRVRMNLQRVYVPCCSEPEITYYHAWSRESYCAGL